MPRTGLRYRHLSYTGSLEARPAESIDLAVIHCTELPDLATAREYGERIVYPESRTGNSGHYYIDRNGWTEEWVPPGRVAHHVRGMNERSLGIELVNRGRYPDWYHSGRQEMSDPYPAPQIGALVALLREVSQRLPNLRWIAGHDSLDRDQVAASDDPAALVRRKLDPGPLFPWEELLRAVPLEFLRAGTVEEDASA
jgi:N-acetylmuramoyl-L-alanine amidase